MAKTGIEVKLKFGADSAKMGELLHRLHLDGLVKFGFNISRMEMVLDGGEERRDKLNDTHLIECAPGQHTLHIDIGDYRGKLSTSRYLTAATMQVPVEQDKITVVNFVWGAGPQNVSMSVEGTRLG
jgi:hypothetical protein